MVDETRIVNEREQMRSLSALRAALRGPLQHLPPTASALRNAVLKKLKEKAAMLVVHGRSQASVGVLPAWHGHRHGHCTRPAFGSAG